jgi:WD40 repeat protein
MNLRTDRLSNRGLWTCLAGMAGVVLLPLLLAPGCGSKTAHDPAPNPLAMFPPPVAPVAQTAPAPATVKVEAVPPMNSPEVKSAPAAPAANSVAEKPPLTAAAPELPAASELPLPAGEFLADLTKDFRTGENPHGDTVGSGKWSYLVSPMSNPWEWGGPLVKMGWIATGTGAPHYEGRQMLQNGQSAVTSLIPVQQGGVTLMPPDVQQNYGVIRWTSGVDGKAVIQGKFRWEKPSPHREMETLVFVDGILAFHSLLKEGRAATMPVMVGNMPSEIPITGAKAPPSVFSAPFRITADLRVGSTVDFVVGMGVFLPQGPADSNATTVNAAIVRTGVGTGYQPDPQVLEQISKAWQATPKRPLPKDADVSTSIDDYKNRLAWYRKTFIGAFRQEYQQDAQSKASAEEFLDGYFRQLVGGDDSAPNDSTLLAAGKLAFPRGKGDPLGDAAVATLAMRQGSEQEYIFGAQHLDAAEIGFPKSHYPPVVSCWYWTLLPPVYQRIPDPMRSQRESKMYVRQAVQDLVLAASQPNLSNHDRQMLVRIVETQFNPKEVPTFRYPAVGGLSLAPQADPWVRELVLAKEHLRLAWIARGEGFANTVTQEGFEKFREQLLRARYHALSAWKLHPELPEAQAVMISLTMASGGVAGEDTRFWFDEALRADLNCHNAYVNYAWSLRPRWGGSHEEMLQLARECLATGRFDSGVPAQYYRILGNISEELGGGIPETLKIPGVVEEMIAMFKGMESKAPNEDLRRRLQSSPVAVLWLAGRKEEARQALAALGPRVHGGGFAVFGITYAQVARALRDDKARPESFFSEHPGGASLVTFVTGNKLLSAEAKGELSVWNVAAGKRERTLAEHSVPLVALQSLSAKKRVLSASRDGKVVIWNSETLKPEKKLNLARNIHAATLRGDSLQVAIACGDKTTTDIVFWDPVSNEQAPFPAGLDGRVNAVAFAVDGKQLHLSIPDKNLPLYEKELFLWDRESGAEPRRFACCPRGLTSWALSADGTRLVVGGGKDYLDSSENRYYTLDCIGDADAATGALRTTLDSLPSPVTSILPLGDGQRVAAVCSMGGVLLWDESIPSPEGFIRTPYPGLTSLTASDDESYLAAVDLKGAIHVWPLVDKKLGWKTTSPLLDTRLSAGLRMLTFTHQGKLVVETKIGGISVWDWASGCRQAERHTQPISFQNLVAFDDASRIAGILVLKAGNTVASVFDASKEHWDQAMSKEGRRFTSIAVSSRGKLLALGDQFGEIILVETDKYQPVAWSPLNEHKAAIGPMCFSDDGSVLVTSSATGEVKWWDLPARPDASTKPPLSRLTFSPQRQTLFRLALSPDNSLIACGLMHTDVFDASSGKHVYSVPGGFPVFSPNGTRLLCGYLYPKATNSARLYEAKTGKELFRLDGGHTRAITCVAISPDSKIGLTGDQDGIVRAWDLESGSELLELPGK